MRFILRDYGVPQENIAGMIKYLEVASSTVVDGLKRSHASFRETNAAHSRTLGLMQEFQRKQRRAWDLLPRVGLGAVFLALAMTVTLNRPEFPGGSRL